MARRIDSASGGERRVGFIIREVVLDCGVAPERVAVIPNWADGDVIEERGEAAQRLRQVESRGAFCRRLLWKSGSCTW